MVLVHGLPAFCYAVNPARESTLPARLTSTIEAGTGVLYQPPFASGFPVTQ